MLKYILVSFCVLSLALVIYFYILGRVSEKSVHVNSQQLKLSQCPTTPNCVCSEYSQDTDHYIEPIKLLSTDYDVNLAKTIVGEMGGITQLAESNYLYATFKSRLFGFIDDFELRLDSQTQLLHIRSASRVGRSDLGANKKRVERFVQSIKENSTKQTEGLKHGE